MCQLNSDQCNDAGDPGLIGDGSNNMDEDLEDNGDGSSTNVDTGDIIDNNSGEIIGKQNADGTWTDTNGNVYSADNVLLSTPQSDDNPITSLNPPNATPPAANDPLAGDTGFDMFGNPTTFSGRDSAGNAIYQSYMPGGQIYSVIVDADGNLISAVDQNGNTLGQSQISSFTNTPTNTSANNGGSLGGGGSGGGGSGSSSGGSQSSAANAAVQALQKALQAALSSGAPTSSTAAIQAALLRAQLAAGQSSSGLGLNTNTLLIGGGLLLAALLASR